MGTPTAVIWTNSSKPLVLKMYSSEKRQDLRGPQTDDQGCNNVTIIYNDNYRTFKSDVPKCIDDALQHILTIPLTAPPKKTEKLYE